jgi:hypothetical protein
MKGILGATTIGIAISAVLGIGLGMPWYVWGPVGLLSALFVLTVQH